MSNEVLSITPKAKSSLDELFEDASDSNMGVFNFMEEYSCNGICLECGDLRDEVEPDATGYECFSCGESKVTGIENAVILFS